MWLIARLLCVQNDKWYLCLFICTSAVCLCFTAMNVCGLQLFWNENDHWQQLWLQIIMMALFLNSTEWQLLFSLTALATSTGLESMAKEPWMDRKTTSAGTIVLYQWCLTEYYTTPWQWRLLLIGQERCKNEWVWRGLLCLSGRSPEVYGSRRVCESVCPSVFPSDVSPQRLKIKRWNLFY